MLKKLLGINPTLEEKLAKIHAMDLKSLQRIKALEDQKAELTRQHVEERLQAEESGAEFTGNIFDKLFRAESELTAEHQYYAALHQRKLEILRNMKIEKAEKKKAECQVLEAEMAVIEKKKEALMEQVKELEAVHYQKYVQHISAYPGMDTQPIGQTIGDTLGKMFTKMDTETTIAATRRDWINACEKVKADVLQRNKNADWERGSATFRVDDEGAIEVVYVSQPPRLEAVDVERESTDDSGWGPRDQMPEVN